MEKKYKTYKELDGGSIERWAEELDQRQKRKLTHEEVEGFLIFSEAEKRLEQDDSIFESILKRWNGTAIIHQRLRCHTFTMSKAAMLCCGDMVTSPGEAVMMMNYIQYRCHRHKIKHVDMEALGLYIMPMGWFDKETLQEFWEKQKYETGETSLANMLDNYEFGLTIRNLQK